MKRITWDWPLNVLYSHPVVKARGDPIGSRPQPWPFEVLLRKNTARGQGVCGHSAGWALAGGRSSWDVHASICPRQLIVRIRERQGSKYVRCSLPGTSLCLLQGKVAPFPGENGFNGVNVWSHGPQRVTAYSYLALMPYHGLLLHHSGRKRATKHHNYINILKALDQNVGRGCIFRVFFILEKERRWLSCIISNQNCLFSPKHWT